MDLNLFFEVGLEPGSIGRSGVGNIVVDAEFRSMSNWSKAISLSVNICRISIRCGVVSLESK